MGLLRHKKTRQFLVLILVMSFFPHPLRLFAGSPSTLLPSFVPFNVVVPPELGLIESQVFVSKEAPRIFLIQDAHGVLDAQRSISRLINYLYEMYGVSLVGVEGASGRLDPLLLSSFPDPAIRRKTMEEYLERGEIGGVGLAAVTGSSNIRYYGIEDWPLYEQNYAAYTAAISNEPQIKAVLESLIHELDVKRRAFFSPELNDLHALQASFRGDPPSFVLLLRRFSQILDSTELYSSGKLKERFPALYQLLNTLKQNPSETGRSDALVRAAAEDAAKKFQGKMPPKKLHEFNSRFQDFLTGVLSRADFLRFMAAAAARFEIEFQLVPELKEELETSRTLDLVQGSLLYEEVMRCLQDMLFSKAADPAQKDLIQAYEKIWLLRDLSKLRLSGAQLQTYMSASQEYLAVVNADIQSAFAPALEFYRLAKLRDRIFQEKIEKSMKEAGTASIIVVTGGFHREGIERLLENNKYSYAVLTPAMNSISGTESYERVMRGDVSYKKYMTANFYDAFTKHASERMLEMTDSAEMKGILRMWRDEVLRKLASDQRLKNYPEYFRYIDRLAAVYHRKKRGPDSGGLLPFLKNELLEYKNEWIDKTWGNFLETSPNKPQIFYQWRDVGGKTNGTVSALKDASGGMVFVNRDVPGPVTEMITKGFSYGGASIGTIQQVRKPPAMKILDKFKDGLSIPEPFMRSELRSRDEQLQSFFLRLEKAISGALLEINYLASQKYLRKLKEHHVEEMKEDDIHPAEAKKLILQFKRDAREVLILRRTFTGTLKGLMAAYRASNPQALSGRDFAAFIENSKTDPNAVELTAYYSALRELITGTMERSFKDFVLHHGIEVGGIGGWPAIESFLRDSGLEADLQSSSIRKVLNDPRKPVKRDHGQPAARRMMDKVQGALELAFRKEIGLVNLDYINRIDHYENLSSYLAHVTNDIFLPPEGSDFILRGESTAMSELRTRWPASIAIEGDVFELRHNEGSQGIIYVNTAKKQAAKIFTKLDVRPGIQELDFLKDMINGLAEAGHPVEPILNVKRIDDGLFEGLPVLIREYRTGVPLGDYVIGQAVEGHDAHLQWTPRILDDYRRQGRIPAPYEALLSRAETVQFNINDAAMREHGLFIADSRTDAQGRSDFSNFLYTDSGELVNIDPLNIMPVLYVFAMHTLLQGTNLELKVTDGDLPYRFTYEYQGVSYQWSFSGNGDLEIRNQTEKRLIYRRDMSRHGNTAFHGRSAPYLNSVIDWFPVSGTASLAASEWAEFKLVVKHGFETVRSELRASASPWVPGGPEPLEVKISLTTYPWGLTGGQETYNYLETVGHQIKKISVNSSRFGLYLAAGADISTFLLATQARQVLMVDQLPAFVNGAVDARVYHDAVSILRDREEQLLEYYKLKSSAGWVNQRFFHNYGILPFIIFELLVMKATDIKVKADSVNLHWISFKWNGETREILLATQLNGQDLDEVRSTAAIYGFRGADYVMLKSGSTEEGPSIVVLKKGEIYYNLTDALLTDPEIINKNGFLLADARSQPLYLMEYIAAHGRIPGLDGAPLELPDKITRSIAEKKIKVGYTQDPFGVWQKRTDLSDIILPRAPRSELRTMRASAENIYIDETAGIKLPFHFAKAANADEFVRSVLANPQGIAAAFETYIGQSHKVNRLKAGDNRVSSLSTSNAMLPSLFIGDLHGRADVLWAILNDKIKVEGAGGILEELTVLEAVLTGRIKLRQVGDVIHPRYQREKPFKTLESFAVFAALIMLKNAAPEYVEMTLGNHEHIQLYETALSVKTAQGEIDLQKWFKNAVLLPGQMGGSAWKPLRIITSEKETRELDTVQTGEYLYKLFRQVLELLPGAAADPGFDTSFFTAHAAAPPLGNEPRSLEDLKRMNQDRGSGLYKEMIFSRVAADAPRNAAERVNALPDILDEGEHVILVTGHNAVGHMQFFDLEGFQQLTEGGQPYFAVMQTLNGNFNVIVDANSSLNKVGYLLVDPLSLEPGSIAGLKAPDGKPGFRVLDLHSKEPSRPIDLPGFLKTSSATIERVIEPAEKAEDEERSELRERLPEKELLGSGTNREDAAKTAFDKTLTAILLAVYRKMSAFSDTAEKLTFIFDGGLERSLEAGIRGSRRLDQKAKDYLSRHFVGLVTSHIQASAASYVVSGIPHSPLEQGLELSSSGRKILSESGRNEWNKAYEILKTRYAELPDGPFLTDQDTEKEVWALPFGFLNTAPPEERISLLRKHFEEKDISFTLLFDTSIQDDAASLARLFLLGSSMGLRPGDKKVDFKKLPAAFRMSHERGHRFILEPGMSLDFGTGYEQASAKGFYGSASFIGSDGFTHGDYFLLSELIFRSLLYGMLKEEKGLPFRVLDGPTLRTFIGMINEMGEILQAFEASA